MVNELQAEIVDEMAKKWEINQIDLSKVSAIPELTQEDREHITCIEDFACLEPNEERTKWFTKWAKDRITEELANKFLLHREELLDALLSSASLLVRSLLFAKEDFIKQIGEIPESDSEESFGLTAEQVFRDARGLGAYVLPDEAYELWLIHSPTILWVIREIASFLGTLRRKKMIGITKGTEISAFGEKFVFRDRKLVEHIPRSFAFSVDDWLKEHEKDGDLIQKIRAYRHYYEDHDLQKVIAHDLGIAQPTVAMWIGQVESKIGYDLGHAFENFFALVRAPVLYRSYRRLGGNSEPDGIGELENGDIEVVSLKCYRDQRGSVTIPRKELRPEIAETIKLVNEGKKARLHLFFREHLRGYEEDRVIDVAKDEPETFSLPSLSNAREEWNKQ